MLPNKINSKSFKGEKKEETENMTYSKFVTLVKSFAFLRLVEATFIAQPDTTNGGLHNGTFYKSRLPPRLAKALEPAIGEAETRREDRACSVSTMERRRALTGVERSFAWSRDSGHIGV